MAAAAAASPLLGAGPPGWVIWGVIVVASVVVTVGAADAILRERERSRERAEPRVEPRVMPREEEAQPGAMRSQIQRGREHLASADVVASDPRRGVTAFEFETIGMMGAFRQYQQLAATIRNPRQPRGNEPLIHGAYASQSIAIRTSIIPAGVVQGGDINALRRTFPDAETGEEVRCDVENLRGHNLRFPR